MKVENKGGSVEFNSPIIIFTCVSDWDDEFGDINEDIGQFKRRLSGTFRFPLEDSDEEKKNNLNKLLLPFLNHENQ